MQYPTGQIQYAIPQNCLTNLASRIFPGACVALQLISRALREGARQRPAFWPAPSLGANSRLVAPAKTDRRAPLEPVAEAGVLPLPTARCRSVGVLQKAQFARPRHAVQTEPHDTDRGKRTRRVRRPTSACSSRIESPPHRADAFSNSAAHQPSGWRSPREPYSLAGLALVGETKTNVQRCP
jgi:hypothetical protein